MYHYSLIRNVATGTQVTQLTEHSLPADAALQTTISAFKESLCISDAKAREIEQGTQDQRLSLLWFSARHYRITASNFEWVLSLKRETPPDSLVTHILQHKQLSTSAIQYSIWNRQ